MNKERIQYLLQLYAANKASREEVEELFEWLKDQEGEEALKKFIFDAADKEVADTSLTNSDWNRMWHSVESATTANAPAKIVRPFWPRIAAAILLLVMGGSAWFYFSRSKTKSAPVVAMVTTKHDIFPGGNKALLTLGDGTTIVLDTVQTGLLALQGQTKVIKQHTGQLIYNSLRTSEQKAGEVLYNTVTTPHGGQFQLVLPDGTKVWLNAGSSLCFPATFSAPKRMVQLTGEAYFEVAHARLHGVKRPFIVSVLPAKGAAPRGQIEVLGTHFNINAYEDEPAIKTTLLEGSVKVSKDAASIIIKPGQQVSLSHSSQLSHPIPVQTDGVIAWKNGYFRFKDTGIRELMRQVERWYNVEVEFKTDRTDQYFTGIVSRSQNISALLQTLELTGTVHFQIDSHPTKGKQGKIIVLP